MRLKIGYRPAASVWKANGDGFVQVENQAVFDGFCSALVRPGAADGAAA